MTGTRGPKGRQAIGVVFIVVGLILTLDQVGVPFLEGLTRWWALLMIGLGIVKMRQPAAEGEKALGVGLVVVGTFFQLQTILAWGKAWPLIFVALGAFLVWQGVHRAPREDEVPPPSDDNTLSELILMGGSKRLVHATDFRGGYVTVFMGGIELDLRRCKIQSSTPAVLDIFVMWGGIDLKVPPEWTVDVRAVPFMGGFDIKLDSPADITTAPRLIVRGHAIMGGAGVHN
jgi:hypothetical protein